MIPNIKSEPLLMQAWTIPTHPVSGSQGQEISSSLSASSPQAVEASPMLNAAG